MPTRLLPALLLVALATACSSPAAPVAQPSPTPTPRPSASSADARSLGQLHFEHGPDDLTLPASADPYTRIDQPNVVTITFDVDQRGVLARWFATRLPAGWQVDANHDDSLLFHDPVWQGAFTCSSQTCALSLRKQS